MTPGQIMRKAPFRRLQPSSDLSALGTDLPLNPGDACGSLGYTYPTYADFMRELSPSAHRIMSEAYYPDIIGYDETQKCYFTRKVARITTNLPQVFLSQRTSMLTGDNVDLKLISGGSSMKNQDLLAEFSEGWLYKDLEVALYNLIYDSFGCGDAAIAFYLDAGKVSYRNFSFPKGDVLYPHYNYMGRLCLVGRRYKSWENGEAVEYLDVFDDRKYMRYRSGKTGKDGTAGWTVDIEPVPHSFPMCPIAYYRREDSVAGPAMNALDNFDISMSQLFENNKQFALRIFYALGADVDIQASVDGRPMTVTSTDSNSKVGFLEPAESSGSFEFQARQLLAIAYQAAHCTQPVELKSGADISSLTVQMMSKDSYHQALLDAKDLQPALNDAVELFKWGYSIEKGKTSKYANLMIKGTINPYIMRSEVEEVNNISILKGAGALPQKAAANEAAKLGYGTPRNYEDILQEEHDRLVLEQGAEGPAPAANPGVSVNESRNTEEE